MGTTGIGRNQAAFFSIVMRILVGNLWEIALSGKLMSEVQAIANKSDSDVIAAIRKGDRDLFRELVERHSPAVFGIAWSRLGDRSLAEEAAQETFIKAYNRLGLLRHSEKFGAWIATIARHVSINLGIRQRREIDKRERWKLEQPGVHAPENPEEVYSEETIQQALGQLASNHRETLVLFYVEGKSIAEAAAALGISETAFKTRLHRARESMRSALENRLESGLEQLRPSRNFAAAVMMALPSQAGGSMLGSGVLASVFKFMPFAYLLAFLQILALVPSILFARWLARKERQNLRDPDGFRGQNFAQMQSGAIWFVAVLIGGAIFVGSRLPEGMPYPFLLAVVVAPLLVWSLRRFYLIRKPMVLAEVVMALLMAAMAAGMHFGASTYWWFFFNAFILGMVPFTFQHNFGQVDFSLFLRAAAGILPPSRGATSTMQFSRRELMWFGRFLARENLVTDWRWRGGALQLKLAAVTPRSYHAFIPMVWAGASVITIGRDGAVTAGLGKEAQRDLRRLGHGHPPGELADTVAMNVAAALEEFRNDSMERAKELLGHQAEEEIFVQPPARTRAARIRAWIFWGAAAMSLFAALIARNDYWSGRKKGLTPIDMTEAKFRSEFAKALTGTNTDHLVFHLLKLPERHHFSAETFGAFHEILRDRIERHSGSNELQRATEALLHDEVLQCALTSGSITSNDFASLNISIADIRREVKSWRASDKKFYLGFSPIQVGHFSYTVLNTAQLNLRMTVLEGCGLLGEFDLAGLVSAIAERQILPELASDNRWDDLDAEALRGLFLMIRANPLRDTYDALCILQRLGALDRIDREECIRGILRFHQGRGLFVKETQGQPNWNVRGNVEDDFCALESLRMLGGLDRVGNLEKWQFRTTRYSRLKKGEAVPWETLVDWALARRIKEVYGLEN